MKKLFSVLVVLLVATALFAQVGLTVKAGGAFGFASNKSVADLEAKSGTQTNKGKWEDMKLADKALILKTNGLGFDVGVQYDITDNLLAYVDFNMLFPKDAKINYNDMLLYDKIADFPADVAKKYLTEDGNLKAYSLKELIADLNANDEYVKEFAKFSTKHSFFSVSAGVAYKLDFNAVKLNVGGGVTLNKATSKFSMEIDTVIEEEEVKVKEVASINFTNIGLNALVEAKYMVADGIGVGLTLMPQLGLYNKAVLDCSLTGGDEPIEMTATSKGFALNFAMPIVVGVSYTF